MGNIWEQASQLRALVYLFIIDQNLFYRRIKHIGSKTKQDLSDIITACAEQLKPNKEELC